MRHQVESLIKQNENQDISHEFALEVLEGLSKKPKWLPSKFFYDKKGSELFQQITDLEEYYPTACEFEILRTHREQIANLIGDNSFNLIELGAGDGRKTFVLLEYFLEKKLPFKYYPIDISKDAIVTLLNSFDERLKNNKNFEGKGLEADYVSGLNWISRNDQKNNFVLFLGSSIGNFHSAGAQRFLRHLWYSLNAGDFVLIGFDLKKDPAILNLAYNDAAGVTREFNLNLLSRINRELGGDFNRNSFIHRSHYNVQMGAIESFIISTERQTVNIKDLDKGFKFKAWEGIHTEYSYKYTIDDINYLLKETGFEFVEHFFDSKKYFVDSVWRVKK